MLRQSIIILGVVLSLALSGCVTGNVCLKGDNGCAVNLSTQQTGDGEQYWNLGVQQEGVEVNVGGKVE
jgi:hypothetical protein